MERHRRVVVTCLVAAMLLGHGIDILLERDDWPFSQYGMYKELQGRVTAREKFVGVTEAGEVPLDIRRQLKPFDPTRLSWALARIRRGKVPGEQQRALVLLLERYEALRAAGRHSGPPLIGLRAYRYYWRLSSRGLTGNKPFKRKLRVEVLRAARGGS